jgi:5-methylcytosine-specific restriction endonuclease McrA
MARLRREGELPVRAVPGVDLQWLRDRMARLAWQVRRRAEDPDTFCVRFASDIPENYKEYLQSPQWKAIQDNVLAEARYECACCFNKATEVHHRDYRPRVLRGEDLSPLVALCHGCHEKIERDHTGAKRKSWNDKERVLAALVARKEGSGRVT